MRKGPWRGGTLALCAALGVALCACSTTVDVYADQKPALALEQFFEGKLTAKGAVYDGSGNVLRRFTADIVGTWQGDRGRLDEVFLWSDGERQLRTWELRKSGANAFQGTATTWWGLRSAAAPATPSTGSTSCGSTPATARSTSAWTTGCI